MPQVQQAGQVQCFQLPDVGEGLTEAEIVTWRVRPGDRVSLNQVVVDVETAKALTELPSPFAGVVTELLVPEGVTVPVGTPIISITVDVAPATSAPPTPPTPPTPATPPATPPARGERTPVLVGYGPRTTAAVRRRRLPTGARPAPRYGVQVLAKPPVRKLARDLGLDLTVISPTGPGGIITRDDVERAAAATPGGNDAPAAGSTPSGAVPATAPSATVAAGETRIPVRGIRKLTAEAMVASAFTAPHVTEWLSVDVTRTMRLVDRLREDREFADVSVSPLLVVAKALLIAVRRNPQINACWDAGGGEIVVKHEVNLGFAVATPRGLVVPNIKGAGRMGLGELAVALAGLTTTAREGRTSASALSGGTITITNVGVFGVDSGTPILNPGEAAILAFGQVRRMPWVHKGKVRPRWVTQLAVSFDHRLVDGDLGSRFLADVGAVLEDPARALVWG